MLPVPVRYLDIAYYRYCSVRTQPVNKQEVPVKLLVYSYVETLRTVVRAREVFWRRELILFTRE
jgi:vancomycin permeability regulator SanA